MAWLVYTAHNLAFKEVSLVDVSGYKLSFSCLHFYELTMQKQLNSGKKNPILHSSCSECTTDLPLRSRSIWLLIWYFRSIKGNRVTKPFLQICTYTKHEIHNTLSKLKAYFNKMPKPASLCCCIISFHSGFINMHCRRQQSLSHFLSVVSHPEPTAICHIPLPPVTAWGDTSHCTED